MGTSYNKLKEEANVDTQRKLAKLIVHMQIHDGYPSNGYQQMTTEQKALYDKLEIDAEAVLEDRWEAVRL